MLYILVNIIKFLKKYILYFFNKNMSVTLNVAGSAIVTGDLTINSDVLYVDSTNNRVGIGTLVPSTTFDVSGNTIIRGSTSVLLSGNIRSIVDLSSNFLNYQPAPTAVSTTPITLTVANLRTRIIVASSTAASIVLPTGTIMEGLFNSSVDMGFDWDIINTTTGTITLSASTDHTIVGTTTTLTGISSSFRSRRTALNTWVTYRIS